MRVLLLLAPLLLGDLEPGRYPVGLRVSEMRDAARNGRAMLVTVWYPARRAGLRTTFRDVLALDRANGGFGAFLLSSGLPKNAVAKWLGAPMLARRGAPALPGRFPLILIAQGNRHTAADQAVLAEYLASHGYIVATVPSPMNITGPMTSDAEIGARAEEQAVDLAFLASVMRRDDNVDAGRVAVIGHSFGARGALLYAMNELAVTALVSLDGGIGVAAGREQLQQSPMFLRGGMRAHVLHFYQELDEFMKPDLALVDGIAPTVHVRRMPAMRHAHFTTTGFAAAAIPDVARVTRAAEGIREDVQVVARATLTFLKGRL